MTHRGGSSGSGRSGASRSSGAGRPASVLRSGRKGSRRNGDESGTKRTLLDNAERLFSAHGYAGTSLDEVVAASRVTKGALYHHFPSKLALFESVFDRLQTGTQHEIERTLRSIDDPWERTQTGLRTFLQVCQEPSFRRICLQEAPAALGHERWSEAQRASTLGIIEQMVTDLLHELQAGDELTEPFAAVFLGAVRSAAEYVADAEDPDAAATQIELVIGAILLGLRSLENLTIDA